MKAFLCIEKFHFFFNLKSELTDYWWISAYHDCDYMGIAVWSFHCNMLLYVSCYFLLFIVLF